MGKKQSTITSASEKETRRDTWKDTVTSFGVSTTSRRGVPPDNIFTPIQADNILPQFPIGKHHPVERKGIEDDEDHMTHTNKFYANIFLGNQGHPIWTHPYSIWWGRGDDSRGQFKTYGLNIAHAEKSDVEFGAGHPVKVRVKTAKLTFLEILRTVTILKESGIDMDEPLSFTTYLYYRTLLRLTI
jgi:endo-1,3(4)-beta-glucanase